MSFGTVFKTREDIVELLRAAYDAFTDVLQKMQRQAGVRPQGPVGPRPDRAARSREDDEDVRRLKNEISSQSGSTYFARMQYGRMVDAALQATVRALRERDPGGAAAGVHRLAHQQADRREA